MLKQDNQPHTSIEDLLNNQDLEKIDVHTLSVPESIKQQWISAESNVYGRIVRYPKLKENFSVDNFVIEAGDQFNAIAMRAAKPDGDFRIFQFTDYGYLGYNKPYTQGVSEQETLYRKHIRVGLVYRFEAVTFQIGREGFICYTRPLALVTRENATRTNFTKFSLMPNDRFILKIMNSNNSRRLSYGKFLSFACFVDYGNIGLYENAEVEVISVHKETAHVRVIQRHVSDQAYEFNKKRIFRESKCLRIT